MYKNLSENITQAIKRDRENNRRPFATKDDDAVRQDEGHDRPTLVRPPFVRDVEKIINLPCFNRLQDKTQVLSLYLNDDISRRLLHVQLVSRIARDISAALGLNVDLTEAIALGHDVGHAPFGHAGERILSELLHKSAGLWFNHNVQSVRALTVLYPQNFTLQTLDGILCHNGEFLQSEYRPLPPSDFADLFERVRLCDEQGDTQIKKLVPHTLEGCVVRLADIIAYVGKDRQDAKLTKIITGDEFGDEFATNNAAIINNMTVDIIENSYGKPYLAMSEGAYNALSRAKSDNYQYIYKSAVVTEVYDKSIAPMFCNLFGYLLDDEVKSGGKGFLYNHHTAPLLERKRTEDYVKEPPARKVCDYLASMTDDYFISLYKHLFKNKAAIKYIDYFD